MYFKDFKGQNDFNVKIDPIKVNKKMILDKIISASSSHKYFFEWTNHKDKVKPFYDIDMYIEGEGDEWKNQIEEVKQKYIDLLSHYYPKGEIAISSSHGEKNKKKTKKGVSKIIKGHAISFHFIINNYECLTLELNRLVVNDNLKKNSLSYFVSQCLKKLPKNSCIVSYADQNNGHNGYIYQATNWIYTGVSTPKYKYIFEDGSSFDIRRGIDKKGKIKDKILLKPTHRYLFFNGTKKQIKKMNKDLKMKIYKYPKGKNIKFIKLEEDKN